MKSLVPIFVGVLLGIISGKYGSVCTAASTAHDRLNKSLIGEGGQQLQLSVSLQMAPRQVREHPQQVSANKHSTEPTRHLFRRRVNSTQARPQDHDEEYDDAALLEDTKDWDNWDNGILRSSAGGGKEEGTLKGKKKEDGKKTLSEQVAEGKYGLIEQELFQTRPKRPGVISYSTNKDTPKDNSKNYGGLNEDDIWLAEDHLLVLKGGSLNNQNVDEPWKPIDDYQAPNRQIKIPTNPKVPPPFPVQFEDNGPIQFIGDHKFPFFYPFENDSIPLYPENGYTPPETNGYDEKNLFTRPGTFKNSTQGKGGYNYPPAIPPWLLNHNATVVNPFLNFPGPPGLIGPNFPYPFNTSLDNLDPEDIDEDDPSIYYPPPYSFVYKNNYSSPVPPGPLVPGIVLPPPPNAFARLEDTPSRKTPPKEIPFRQVLTQISEFKPKSTTPAPRPLSPPSTTTTTTLAQKPRQGYYITRRPKPDDNSRTYLPQKQPAQPTTKLPPIVPEEIITFIPKSQPSDATLSQGSPIYYEYFDAQKLSPPQKVSNEYTTLTAAAPQPSVPHRDQQVPSNHRKPILDGQVTLLQPQNSPQNQRLNKSYLPLKPYDEYLYITPKPEIKPNGISHNYLPIQFDQVYKVKPDFTHEIDSIRQTLEYYRNHQLKQNQIPRTPKGKAVYEHSFDTSGSHKKEFNPPFQYDDEPFKPMVQYSRPFDDSNGFKAIPYTITDGATPAPPFYYTTLPPQPSVGPSTVRTSSKPYSQPNYSDSPQELQYSTPKTILTDAQQQPWFAIEKQVLEEVASPRPVEAKHRAVAGYSRKINTANRQNNAYFYERPLGNRRQNNRYIKYSPEIPINQQLSNIRTQLNQYPQQPIPVSLENDTWVNYQAPLQPVNPDAEYVLPPSRRQQYQQYVQNHQQRLPIVVHPSHQAQFQPYQPQISLHRDILVNYRNPLPPINPDSEFIAPQFANRQHYGPSILQQLRQVPPQLQQQPQRQQQLHQQSYNRYSNDQSNIYYLTPQNNRYKKSNQ